MTKVQKVEDQTRITELSIMPDGRVYVFGTSRKVLEVLEAIGSKDQDLVRLLQHVRQLEGRA